MKEKLQALLDKLHTERDDFRVGLHLLGMEAKEEWEKAEGKWENLQVRLRDTGLKLHMEAKEEIHDMGEEVDKLQHKLTDKWQDIRVEVVEELHELGEEVAELYQKIRRHF
ncbi:MAG TPA: hypothetical protein PLE99_10515 [Candidatus Thiothrix moscowensis]|uniref:hypothetical protein n=1 Tax=unclassified Thiothrix TaxID=2636184 RepID=UPI0025FB64A0|nr:MULTISPECIES: hypothetical protein [unclassified Thiothrix]HRJ53193.1 hypothetical protein [Candidatus Thiothrix moscowensis]HRJ93237.1 hypothetical protein [Candidatus Thiothrix moscowensis]